MGARPAITIVLLAGGRATRFPGKLMRAIDDEPMLLRVFRRLTRDGRPCIISLREPLPERLASLVTAPVVIDAYGDVGPLGGLASAAGVVKTPWLFAAAADLPCLDSDVVDALEHKRDSEARRDGLGPQAVVPRHPDGALEPLAALYETTSVRTSATRALARGGKKMTGALEGLRLSYYEIPADERVKFLNVNTAGDLAVLPWL